MQARPGKSICPGTFLYGRFSGSADAAMDETYM